MYSSIEKPYEPKKYEMDLALYNMRMWILFSSDNSKTLSVKYFKSHNLDSSEKAEELGWQRLLNFIADMEFTLNNYWEELSTFDIDFLLQELEHVREWFPNTSQELLDKLGNLASILLRVKDRHADELPNTSNSEES